MCNSYVTHCRITVLTDALSIGQQGIKENFRERTISGDVGWGGTFIGGVSMEEKETTEDTTAES